VTMSDTLSRSSHHKRLLLAVAVLVVIAVAAVLFNQSEFSFSLDRV